MIDTDQILIRMDEGFGKVHDRLNTISGESAIRQLGCAKRFGEIEQTIAVRSAVNGVHDSAKRRRVDFESGLVRTLLAVIIVGGLAIIWKLFIAHVPLIGG